MCGNERGASVIHSHWFLIAVQQPVKLEIQPLLLHCEVRANSNLPYWTVKSNSLDYVMFSSLTLNSMHKALLEVYHASKTSGLKRIEPQVSTHGQAWIYAARNELTAAMFLGRHHDFILGSGFVEDQAYIVERFAGAFERAKSGATGSIYTLPGSSFQAGRTGFREEVVSEIALEPLGETVVSDAATHLLGLEVAGQLEIYRYPNRPCHVPEDDSDLIASARELYAEHGQRLLDFLTRETGDSLAHVVEAVLESQN
jgi:hypothetical protein